MKPETKTKLCWNCEGRVTHEEENCPYCGVYLSPSLTPLSGSHLSPPYSMEDKEVDGQALEPPYAHGEHFLEPEQQESHQTDTTHVASENLSTQSSVVLPLSTLLAGSIFFLFGFILLLFSQNGIFTLRWNGDLWPVYLLSGVVMLLVGWKTLGKIEN